MPGNKKLSSNIKSMGFMKRSAEKVDIETNESKKRKRELEIYEKQWKTATTTNNNKINKKGISNTYNKTMRLLFFFFATFYSHNLIAILLKMELNMSVLVPPNALL